MKFKFTEDKKRKKLNDVIYKDNVGNMEISNNFFNNSTDSSAMSEEKITEEILDDELNILFKKYKSLSTNAIKQLLNLKDNKVIDKKSPMFITPDGDIISVGKTAQDNNYGVEYESVIHSDMPVMILVALYNNDKLFEAEQITADDIDMDAVEDAHLLEYLTDELKWIRINTGETWVEDRFYAVLPDSITKYQIYALEDWLNYGYENKKDDVMMYFPDKNFITDLYPDTEPKDIIKRINYYYTNGTFVEDVEDQDLGTLSYDMETDKTELEIDDTMLDLLDLKYIDEDFIPTGYMMYDLRMTEEFDEEDELALLEDASGKEYMVVASNKETPVKFEAGDTIPSTGDGIIFASRFPTREDAISFARERRQKNPEEEVDIYSGRVTAMNEFKCSVAMNEGGLENLKAIGRAIKDGVVATKQSIANYRDDKYEQRLKKSVDKAMYKDMEQNAEMFADKWKVSEKELKHSKNREAELKDKLKNKSQITVMDVDKAAYEKEKAELEKNPNPKRVDIGGRFVDKNKVRAVIRADDNTLRQLTVDQFNKLPEKEKENFVGWSSLNSGAI